MNSPIRIVHCGDVHLGAGRQVHRERYEDLFRVFQEVVDASHGADLLLISGDFFDVKEPDPETLARAVGILRALRERDDAPEVVVIEGNHDMRKRARGQYRNEKGVHDVLAEAGLVRLLRPEIDAKTGLLSFEGAVYDLEGTDLSVLGLGYFRDDVASRFREATAHASEALAERRVIVLAHLMLAHEGVDPYHGSAAPSELLPVPDNVIYVALGHGHGRVGPGSERHFDVFYSPGSLEFVHARNTRKSADTRGFFNVEIDDGGVAAIHRPTVEKRPFLHLEIELHPERDSSFDAVRSHVLDRFRSKLDTAAGRSPILSVSLAGRIGFPASAFRNSLIDMDLRREFEAIQVFVRREALSGADGSSLAVDVREGYEDALRAGIQGLIGQHAAELGVLSDDPVLVPSILQAIRSSSDRSAELARIQAHLRACRPEDASHVVVEVDMGGSSAESLADQIRATTDAHLEQGQVSIVLVGDPPRDEAGLPIPLDAEALREQAGIPADGVVIEIGDDVFDSSRWLDEEAPS